MSVKGIIESRYSCRGYADKPVDKAIVEEICKTALLAPSACNSQPWKIHAVFGAKKEALGKALQGVGINAHVSTAPVILAIEQTHAHYYSKFDGIVQPDQWAAYDVGGLTAHIILLAKEYGLDTCVIGYNRPAEAKAALGLDESTFLPLFLTLGYAKEDGVIPAKKRKPVEEGFVIEE